jgi:hypothetical protein
MMDKQRSTPTLDRQLVGYRGDGASCAFITGIQDVPGMPKRSTKIPNARPRS